MKADKLKAIRRQRRKRGIARRIRGTPEAPRLTVFRSGKHIYAQLVDDLAGRTLCAASTRDRALREKIARGGNIEAAKIVGGALAEIARSRNIERVRFDRNGYRYHGRVKALADAAREGGLKF